MPADYDSPWKEAMDRAFERFLAFFLPLFHALLDWKRDYEPLDTELRKIAHEAETGKRYIDKLVKAHTHAGDPRLIHVELQCDPEEGFGHRQHVYNYRIEDVYSHPVLTGAILGDDDPDWRPGEYRYEEAGVERTLKYPVVKLLDFADKLDETAKDENPFGAMVVAHLIARRTKPEDAERKEWKKRLFRELYDRGMDAGDLRQWLRLIDWLLPLPAADDKEVWEEIHKRGREVVMPFVPSFERFIAEDLAKRADESAQKAQDAQRKAEDSQRKAEDAQRKADDAQRQLATAHLRGGIEALLQVRFGAEGLALMPQLSSCEDIAKLEAVRDSLAVGSSALDDVRKLID